MPPKDAKPKKLDAKELEALRLAEEAKKKEEEEKIRLEELKKYEMRKLSTGLEMILTEFFVQEMWKHETPKEFAIEFMSKNFTKEKMIDRFNKNDMQILAEFHTLNLIFAKEILHLDDNKAMVLLNIFWELIKNNNPKYQTTEKPKTGTKTRENDYEVFKFLLVKHCVDNPPENLKYFLPEQVKLILEYSQQGYLNHFNLYKYVDTTPQKEEETQSTVYIDAPLETSPLAEAKFLGTEKSVIKDEEEEMNRQIQEKLKKQEEIEQRRKEEQEAKIREREREREIKEQELDPDTMEIIRQKIKEAEDSIQKSLTDRQKELDDKFENITKQKKK